MGALLPVGSGPDAEIVQTLNDLFKLDKLAALRRHHRLREKLFGPGHRLRRVALRIGAYPARDYGTDDAKRKWFFFLHHVLPQETQDAIKRILNDAMTRLTIKAVEFSVEENSVVTAPHLFPSNGEDLDRYLNAAGNKYRVHLVVKAPMADDAEDPPDNDPDSDEKPIEWPTLKLGRPPFGKAKKGSKAGGKKAGGKKKAAKTSRKR
jgi:hypothetical protein